MHLIRRSKVSDLSQIGNVSENRWDNLEGDNLERRSFKCENVKLVLIMIVPVIGVISLSSVLLHTAISDNAIAIRTSISIQDSLNLQSVIECLQRERGKSALFLSHTGDRSDVSSLYYEAIQHTSLAIQHAHLPLHVNTGIGGQIMSNQEWAVYLNSIRHSVTSLNTSLIRALQEYTRTIKGLIISSRNFMANFQEDNYDCSHSYMTSNAALLEATDAVGLQRALGSAFLQACNLPIDVQRWFFILQGQEIAYLQTATVYDNTLRFDDALKQSSNRSLTLNAETSNFWHECANKSASERHSDSIAWFDDLTAYLEFLISIRRNQSDDLSNIFRMKSEEAHSRQTILLIFMIGLSVFCISLCVQYLRSINTIMWRMKKYASMISQKSKELQNEKNKTERLLHEMLPREIADQLKENREVPAEHYDECTIYFSDIVSFTELGSRSTPFQIVNFLNKLYSLFDGYIDRHDVYKVETIGDAYMVVSGVPNRNGIQHVAEVAKTAIDIRSAVSDFRIPHMHDEQLQIRIGMHTGPCVAGIVGVKMPRYCLFGDTVNVAARMESTGEAMKIHISSSTTQRLQMIGGYKIKVRGEMDIKVDFNIFIKSTHREENSRAVSFSCHGNFCVNMYCRCFILMSCRPHDISRFNTNIVKYGYGCGTYSTACVDGSFFTLGNFAHADNSGIILYGG